MNFRFSEEEEAFRQEVRDFIKKEVPPDFRGADVCTQWEEEAIDEVHAFDPTQKRPRCGRPWPMNAIRLDRQSAAGSTQACFLFLPLRPYWTTPSISANRV